MSLTICTVVYNEERNLSTIEHNLRLLREMSPPIEFLLIDNCSTDGSPQALQALSVKYGARYLTRVQNHLPQARQQALQTSATKWVGFVDADCRIDNDWIFELQRRIAVDVEGVAAFGGPWEISGGAATIYQGLFATFLGHFGNPYLSNESQKKYVEHLPTANIIYHLERVKRVGGFSSLHPTVGEDLDLSCRLAQRGFKIEYIPKLKIKHQLPTSLPSWCGKMFLYGTARGEILYRYGEISSYKAFLPVLFLLLALVIWYLPEGLFFAFFGFYLAACVFCSLSREKVSLFFLILLRMLATHVFYAFGVYNGYSRSVRMSLEKKLARWFHKDPALEDRSV